jgi:endoglucanase
LEKQKNQMRAAAFLATASLLYPAFAQSKVQCPGTFKSISAVDFVKAINPGMRRTLMSHFLSDVTTIGWNLGNTLDAVPDEGSWNNPAVKESTFDDIKAAGFKGIRLPGVY